MTRETQISEEISASDIPGRTPEEALLDTHWHGRAEESARPKLPRESHERSDWDQFGLPLGDPFQTFCCMRWRKHDGRCGTLRYVAVPWTSRVS